LLRTIGEPLRRLLAPLLAAIALVPLLSVGTAPSSARAAEERAIYRIAPTRGADLARLLALGFDRAGYGPGASLDFILTPEEASRARSLGFSPVLVAGRGGPLAAAASPLAKPGLGDYHTWSEANAEMTAYAAAHPTLARLDTLGWSLEGRPLVSIEISDNPGVDEGEPEAFVNGCHHARELMSVELPLYLMRRLLDGYGSDPVLTALVNSRRIWILPVVNPDGYVYVEQNSAGQSGGWWRKNRRPNGDGTYGVDLNRNYGYEWGYDDVGSSPTTSSELYRGTGPFSEPETAAIRDFIDSHQFSISVSYHSYGDLVLYPWGYDRLDPAEHAVFFALGDSMALQNGYRAGNPKSNAIYLTNGGSDDWLYGEAVLKPPLYGFTVELNSAAEGFDPPEGLIVPTCEANWGPLLTLLRYADAPRRVLGPPRPQSPRIVVGPGSAVRFEWSYPNPDPANSPARHDVRLIAQALRSLDDAEAGPADWDSLRIAWSTARSADGSHSYWSGSSDNRESILASRASLDVGAGDSLVAWAWWDLEPGYDYWYAQASTDGGATWHSLAGTHTTNLNPSGQNEGFGVTGSSGDVFVRTAFSLLPFGGQQVRLRFRCVTDAVNHNEGLYLDDITPDPRYAGVQVQDTGDPDTVFALHPIPTQPTWVQVRGYDGEGQPSYWSDRVLFSPNVAAVLTSEGAGATDRLWGIAPNPANPRAAVRFALAAGAAPFWRLDCYDASGRWRGRIAEGRDGRSGGSRQAVWTGRDRDGGDLPSGVYFLRLTHGSARRTVKAALIR
jgi:hypothetical protein